jgi:predicted nuclease with TOPRIM domain
MIQKFEMSMMGELKYFLGFQVKKLQEGTFISQTKYIQDILNKFGMKDIKPIKTPMGTNGHLDLRTENDSLITKIEKINVYDDSIVSLRNENASLIAKIDKLNESISSLKTENEKLISKAKDLNVCNISISNLRNENAMLHAKIDELNAWKPSTSSVDHVTLCTRCGDINVDAIHDHLSLIKQQNDHIAQLTSKINEHEIENEKI